MTRLPGVIIGVTLCLTLGTVVSPAQAHEEFPIVLDTLVTLGADPATGTPAQAWGTFASLDGATHTIALGEGTLGPEFELLTFRAWWERERQEAPQVLAALEAREMRVEQMDQHRWLVLAAVAPGLWPLAGGYGAVLALPMSADHSAEDPDPFGWDLRYDPLPDAHAEVLWRESEETPDILTLAPTPPEAELPGMGILFMTVDETASVPTFTISMLDGIALDPPVVLTPRLWRAYGVAGLTSTSVDGELRVQIDNLLDAWQRSDAHTQEVILPEAGFRLRYTGSAGTEPVTASSRWPGITQPIPWGLLSLIAYAGAGWLLTRSGTIQSPARRLGIIALGWLAGWVLALLAFPLYGLGLLPGAVATNWVWSERGLGPASTGRWLGIVAFLLAWSLLSWPLIASQGTLPLP